MVEANMNAPGRFGQRFITIQMHLDWTDYMCRISAALGHFCRAANEAVNVAFEPARG